MKLRFYSIRELMDAAKAVLRALPAIGFEAGTDHDVILYAAARLLQGAQVAGRYIYDQISPSSADANSRDRMIDFYGLTFAKPATKARGLIAVRAEVPAGTLLEFPAEAFQDGVARSFITLENAINPRASDLNYGVNVGSTIHKLRVASGDGVVDIDERSIALVVADDGATQTLTGVRRTSLADQSIDLHFPIKGIPTYGSSFDGPVIQASGSVVAAECTEAGASGNCNNAETTVGDAALDVTILEMAGGGDEIGDIDGDTARVVRLIEDTMACPPGFGNAQHWREVALACPDVDLDDAVVYQHVRGPGTIDLVCIGRSGGLRSSTFPDAHLEFTFYGNNARRIGDVQAAKVEAWCKTKASYFDDVTVHSVEWDWCGEAGDVFFTDLFFSSYTSLEITLDYHSGYGPDSGVALSFFPYTRSTNRLYGANEGDSLDPSLRPGHRVWVTVAHENSDGRHAFATVVTEVVTLDPSGKFATIADVTGLAPANVAQTSQLAIIRWGTAGPLTQPALDAVFAYFDALGPGSYLLPPKDPGYVRTFWPDTIANPEPGLAVDRWPPEGRRWSAGLRASELQARLLAIEGVRSVDLGRLIDFDPEPLKTLALTGAVVRY